MRKFKGMRSLADLIQRAGEEGWEIETSEFDKSSDWIWLRDIKERMLQVKVNLTNGIFFVWNPVSEMPIANHLSLKFDNEDWYLEILNLFYVGIEE
ncbi:hypothetical protein HYG86_09260 [Alkalicella caledoniensis]|uniref:Uncharacterized protein n=1 Tax=Alkalicella caledoniensis TaxID=2731377 RepID=A0A7G9W8D7_ALKCA|nr:hypothetical protein [Alkalicella caledoniensis]QNO14949.1 hypothetical protein HYG86_09260 [Alkalicella caledoniensis]